MIPQFDPSKMDPKLLMELSRVVQELPPSQLSRMQTLMHNMMAGFDVSREMAEFEQSLPPGFREKLMTIMTASGATAGMNAGFTGASSIPVEAKAETEASTQNMNLREARLTLLRAVASGSMSPEEAEKLLFQGS
jgi:hypothetical protein